MKIASRRTATLILSQYSVHSLFPQCTLCPSSLSSSPTYFSSNLSGIPVHFILPAQHQSMLQSLLLDLTPSSIPQIILQCFKRLAFNPAFANPVLYSTSLPGNAAYSVVSVPTPLPTHLLLHSLSRTPIQCCSPFLLSYNPTLPCAIPFPVVRCLKAPEFLQC